MSSLETLAAAWAGWRAAVIPITAPVVQVVESRRAFYAGAAAFLEMQMKALSPGADETPGDLARMDGWYHELRQFQEDVRAGKA
jgi:hypothetical protein